MTETINQIFSFVLYVVCNIRDRSCSALDVSQSMIFFKTKAYTKCVKNEIQIETWGTSVMPAYTRCIYYLHNTLIYKGRLPIAK